VGGEMARQRRGSEQAVYGGKLGEIGHGFTRTEQKQGWKILRVAGHQQQVGPGTAVAGLVHEDVEGKAGEIVGHRVEGARFTVWLRTELTE
jgi:hypothetical protein